MNGACLGAGFELAMACDLRVAAAGAPHGAPRDPGRGAVGDRGGAPARPDRPRAAPRSSSSPARTSRRAGPRLGPGEPRGPARGAQGGHRGSRGADPRRGAGGGAPAEGADRPLADTDLRTAIAYGINAFAQTYASDDVREATQAFLDKRPARFAAPPGAARPAPSTLPGDRGGHRRFLGHAIFEGPHADDRYRHRRLATSRRS